MNDTARRIRDVRNCLKLSQSEFAAIFTSQRKAGQKLNARGVSYWETGRSQPTHRQLTQLLDFLEDPDNYLAEECPGYTRWTALRYLVWYDPQAAEIEEKGAFSFVLQPRLVKGRRLSLERLVFDILDLHEPPDQWTKRLERCSALASSAPFEEIQILRRADTDGERFILAEHEALLQKDIEQHGASIAGLLLKEYRQPEREYARDLMDRFLQVYGQLFSEVSFGDGEGSSFEEQVDDFTVDSAYGFNLAVLMISTILASARAEERDKILRQLIERAKVLDLLVISTRSAQVYGQLADLQVLRIAKFSSRGGRSEEVKAAAGALARYVITQDPEVFHDASKA